MNEEETAPPATEAAPPEAAPKKKTPDWIEYSRFTQANEAKKQFEAELLQIRPQLETLKTAAAELEQARSRIEQLQSERDMAANAVNLARVHPSLIDDEAQGIAQAYYSRLPVDDRPPIADWLKSSIESGTIPKGLMAWFSGAPQQPAARPVTQAQAPVSASQPGPAPVTVTRELLDEIRKTDPGKALAMLRALQKK